jgi:peptidoglycan/LPS O-acetylase OafA/YrhL
MSSENPRGFIPRVESIRGIAAVLVGCYHVGQSVFPAVPQGIERLYMGICNGIGCVVAFFVISGFVLARSLDRKIASSDHWAPRYFTSRVFRLYPAAIVAIVAFVILRFQFEIDVYLADYDPFNMLLNVLMVRTDIDRVMWSMKVELVATPLIPLAVIAFHRWGWRALFVAITLLFGCSFFGQYSEALGQGSNLGPLYAFIVGVLLHFCGPGIAARIRPALATPIAIASIVVFVACGTLKPTAIQVMFECLSAATLILIVVWHPASAMFKLLDFAIVRFYGRISYSFYLLHPLTFLAASIFATALNSALHGDAPPVVIALATALFSTLLITPAAYLSWRFVEMPGVALGRAIYQRRLNGSHEIVADDGGLNR